MMDAYSETGKYNRTVVGGNGRTVALGGFITGGGHSILALHYGLAVDQVLEMEVVTPKGEILTVNECQNQDLFWALRGGGGSTFGVLTSVTMKTFPSPRVSTLNFAVSTSATNPAAFDMITYILGQYPALADSGISGYPIIFNTVPNTLDGGLTTVTGILGKVIMLNTTSAADIVARFQPLFDHINATWPGQFTFYSSTMDHPSFAAWYLDNYDASPVGYENVMGSRLLDVPALTANATATKQAFQKFSLGGQATVYIVSGKGVWEAQPRGGGNAAHPAWRKTLAHASKIKFPLCMMDVQESG
jgi:hypothetical protein